MSFFAFTSARSINTPTSSTATSSSPRNSTPAMTTTTPKNSTGQTSLESSLKDTTKDTASSNHNDINKTSRGAGQSSPERRGPPACRNHHYNAGYITSHLLGRHHRDHNPNQDETRESSPDSTLTTIQETPLDQIFPSILTVERAAAAKINLETYYQELLLSGPSAREVRAQLLEAHLFSLSRQRTSATEAEVQAIKARFYRRETEYLREMRVLKTKSMRALREPKESALLMNEYEEVRILGKGSFGVVKLVREKNRPGQVYAMKCIRKGDMLKTQQEGHLKAERDLLIAGEGSRWIIQLIASFQDLRNLYLVTEYMPGGDFLGFIIRENVLEENVAKFYVAEMILCVEAAHSLQFIHRDIKPDNFLISSSGHLKISDFGLAFDGEWLHDMAYYNSHRYALVNKLGIVVEGDEKDKNDMRSMQETMKWTSHVMTGIEKHQSMKEGDKVLNWRNRCGNRAAARSIVGTSQYMAPEVVLGDNYDARCDYWSVGVILYECLYGQTPFYTDEGRNMTKKNILEHKEKLRFPTRAYSGVVQNVSSRCKDLLLNLITDRENRLCSRRYYTNDVLMANRTIQPGCGTGSGNSMSAAALYSGGSTLTPPVAGGGAGGNNASLQTVRASKDIRGHYVFPFDAEDIKAHKWFASIPWERLHEMTPPHVPQLRSCDDTAYFNDKSVSDWSDTELSGDEYGDNQERLEVREVEIEPGTPPGLLYNHEDTPLQCFRERYLPETPPDNVQYRPVHGMAEIDIRGCDGNAHDPFTTPQNMSMLVVRNRQQPMCPDEEQLSYISPFTEHLQTWALSAVSIPIDGSRLAEIERQIECMGLSPDQQEYLRIFVYRFGVPKGQNDTRPIITTEPPFKKKKKKAKRPRDKILRDKNMAKTVLEERRRTAFGGYEWKKIRDEDDT